MRNSKLAFFGLGALVACIAFILGHITTDITTAQNAPTVFDEIQVRSLRVVDDTGNTVIRFKAGIDGGLVSVYDKNGKVGVGLGISDNDEAGGIVQVFSKNGKGTVVLAIDENGGRVNLRGNLGKGGVGLSVDSADGSGVVGVHTLDGTGHYFRRW